MKFSTSISRAACWLLLFTATRANAQFTNPPGGVHENTPSVYALTHANIVIKPGLSITDGTLIIRDGVIENVGANLRIPEDATVRDLQGMYVYPGLIEIWSDYGRPAPPKSKRSWNDPPQYETDSKNAVSWNQAVKPEYAIAPEFKPSAKDAAALRAAGFTTAQVVPSDGIFRGTAALVHLGDNSAGEALEVPETAWCLSFSKGSSSQAYPSSLMGSIALIRQVLYDAAWYGGPSVNKSLPAAVDYHDEDLSLRALSGQIAAGMPVMFESGDWKNTLRAAKIAAEFGLKPVYLGQGDEYKQVEAIKKTGAQLIVPLNFPEAYDVKDFADAREVDYTDLREWELAPMNASMLAARGVPFAFTSHKLKKPADAWGAMRKAVSYGLSEDEALAAFTTVPARMLGQSKRFGSLEKGRSADFFICAGPIFSPDNPTIYETWVEGEAFVNSPIPETDLRGTYSLRLGDRDVRFILGGDMSAPTAHILDPDTLKVEFSHGQNGISLSWNRKDETLPWRLRGVIAGKELSGSGEDPEGKAFDWAGDLLEAAGPNEEKEWKEMEKAELAEIPAIPYPFSAYGREKLPAQETILIKNATLWTNSDQGILQNTDLLIVKGKIIRYGKNIPAPENCRVIEGNGYHVSPGIIDEHSHIAINGGVNEGTHAITAEVSIADVVNNEDVNIYRQLAGGTVASQLLHGSANPIGGQSALIKLRWGMTPEQMKIEDADGFIKFALGENVKQSNWGDNNRSRFPQTRLGVEQLIRDGFITALDYRREKKAAAASGKRFRINLQLETLLEILDKKRFVTCHSYVQSEITMLMRLAESFDFRINTFTHVLEGYKIADKLKAHGASASTFSDWWAYKYEVIDAIPHNAAMLAEAGVNTCINSDDAEMGRRLNQEAAKAMKYGGLSAEDALKLVTLNPAIALHLDHRMGKIAPGYDADIVVWSGDPLSVYSIAQYTLVDGRVLFDRNEDARMREFIEKDRHRLITKMMKEGGEKRPPHGAKGGWHYECETLESDYR